MPIKTVLGDISENVLGVTLAHEHICCYSDYVYNMIGNLYLDKEKLINASIKYLIELKEKYALKTFIDCTPVNIGRDIDLLKKISQKSGVNIICSTGFYYTEETLLYNTSAETAANYIISDAKNVNAGIIKCAVEKEKMSSFNKKILIASAKAQLALGLPVVLHTNAKNKNGMKALEILISEGVKPQAITVAHLSDTSDMEYVFQILEKGCFIGFDRLYNITNEEYINQKVNNIKFLCENGYLDKILLSHDALFFNGFEAEHKIDERPRFEYGFEYILPNFSRQIIEEIMIKNPIKMLKCGK